MCRKTSCGFPSSCDAGSLHLGQMGAESLGAGLVTSVAALKSQKTRPAGVVMVVFTRLIFLYIGILWKRLRII